MVTISIYDVKYKIKGTYVVVGQTVIGTVGLAQLPVITTTQKGMYIFALIDPTTGKTD